MFKLVHLIGRFYWLRPTPIVAIRLNSRKAVWAGNVLVVCAWVAIVAAIVKVVHG